MNTSAVQMPRRVRGLVTALSLAGLAGLMLTFWFGFEEPNSLLFSASGVMALAAPAAAFLHLATTRGLTTEHRQIWWKEFASGEIWSAFAEYLSSDDLGVSASRRAAEAETRRSTRR